MLSNKLKIKIKRFCLQNFPRVAVPIWGFRTLVTAHDSYLHQTGWLNSLRTGKPLDQCNQPVPWMNYPVIALLTERLRRELTLFEFGCGYSTIYFARRVAEVVAVEHDEDWLHVVRTHVPANVQLILQPVDVDGAYCRAICRQEHRFDLVVIDGRDRVHCMAQSFD